MRRRSRARRTFVLAPATSFRLGRCAPFVELFFRLLAIVGLLALAVTTATRASFLPNVPAMAETVPGYDTEVWWGLLGPAGMPPDVVAKLSHDFVAALNTEQVKERLNKLGAMPIGSSPAQFDAKIHADYDKWGPIIKAAGLKPE